MCKGQGEGGGGESRGGAAVGAHTVNVAGQQHCDDEHANSMAHTTGQTMQTIPDQHQMDSAWA